MSEPTSGDRRLYKARGPDGEVAWVDHDELWRLQQRQAQELRRERVRRRRLLLAGLAVLVLAMLVLAFLRLRQEAPPPVTAAAAPAPEADVAKSAAVEETSSGEAGASTAADPETLPSAPPPPEAAAASAAPEPALPIEPVAAAVRSWADAWERRDVEAYLASYGSGFRPGDGASRSAWRSLRRRRLERPAWIRVEIDELEIAWREDGGAEASFRQRYESPLYADVVRKRLELAEEDGAWRIVAERAEPGAAGR